MSWWETGSDRLTIGDGPADIIADFLKNVANVHIERKPSIEDLLNALTDTLGYSRKIHLLGNGAPLQAIVARSASRQEWLGKMGAEIDPGFKASVQHTVEAVVEEYRLNLERKPTTDEVLACFLFVLRRQPDEFLSDVDGSLQELHRQS